MSLIRKSNSTSSQVPSQLIGSLSRGLRAAVPTMDRRAFLKRSGIGVGAGIAATQLNWCKKHTRLMSKQPLTVREKLRLREQFVLTAQWVAPLMQLLRTAFGFVRNLSLILQLIWVAPARRAQPYVSTGTVIIACVLR